MKRNVIAIVLSTILAIMASPAEADLVASLDFESGVGVGYTVSLAEQTDGSGDYFTLSDGTNIGATYNTPQGSNFFAAQDTDADGGVSPASLFFSDIDITGFTDLNIELLVAEDDDGTNQDWDSGDSFEVFASIDGGAQFKIFAIENDGSTFNSAPLIDDDLDGIGEGTEITDTFANFLKSFAGTGSDLDLEFRFSLNSGDEDLAIDNIRINGTVSAIPEPTAFLFGSLIAGMMGLTVSCRRA